MFINFVHRTSVNAQPLSPPFFEKISPHFQKYVFVHVGSLRWRFLTCSYFCWFPGARARIGRAILKEIILSACFSLPLWKNVANENTHTHNPQSHNGRNMVAEPTKHFPKTLAGGMHISDCIPPSPPGHGVPDSHFKF